MSRNVSNRTFKVILMVYKAFPSPSIPFNHTHFLHIPITTCTPCPFLNTSYRWVWAAVLSAAWVGEPQPAEGWGTLHWLGYTGLLLLRKYCCHHRQWTAPLCHRLPAEDTTRQKRLSTLNAFLGFRYTVYGIWWYVSYTFSIRMAQSIAPASYMWNCVLK